MISRRQLLIGLLCVAWIVPGLLAHDPWKPDEATNFGIVYEMLRGGTWLYTTLAGEPYFREPPLYYITAALSATLLSPPLALHDAARLVSGLYIAVSLIFCGLAARELNGPGAGGVAIALLIGCVGLVIRSHQLVPHLAALAGFALIYYGCARALTRSTGGLAIGTGMGLTFMSLGLAEAVVATLLPVLLPLLGREWRTRAYAVALGFALVAALPWLLIWPTLLHMHSPDLFAAWWQTETEGRLFRAATSGFYYLRILPWYAWPVWPLAVWALWRAFGQERVKTAITLPLVGLVVTMLALSEAADKRELYAMPLLLPLTLLATPGLETLRRGAANAWYWFSVMGFTFFILVGWFYWSGLELGFPPRLHAHLLRLQPAYEPGVRLLPLFIALAYTAAWFVVLARVKRSPQRPAFVWATGITVTWTLAATLFIGWVDAGKSYRGMIASLAAALPATYNCVASREVGEAQRSMLHYFANIVVHRDDAPDRRQDCELLIVQGTSRSTPAPDPAWFLLWEGSRPGDRSERYWLYRRSGRAVSERTERKPVVGVEAPSTKAGPGPI